MWVFKSPVGRMSIWRDKNDGRYALQINGTVYGTYHSAVSAADDVFTFTTDCDDWDRHDGSDKYEDIVPTDISEWEEVN